MARPVCKAVFGVVINAINLVATHAAFPWVRGLKRLKTLIYRLGTAF
jgi:hypothetical protein